MAETQGSQGRQRVLISAPGFGRAGDQALEMLRGAGYELVPSPKDGLLSEDEMVAAVGDVDAVIAGVEPITSRVLEAAPRLRVVARRGVGYDTVDVAAATARKVAVTITVGALTETVADLTFGLLLAAARKIPLLDRMVKAGGWDRIPSTDVCGKTLGLVGFGAIGRAVARRAEAFEMRVIACDLKPDEAAASALGAELCDLGNLLSESDFISIHVPLTPATRGMVDAAALRRMKRSAILINTSRGDVVDEPALIEALREGVIAGAALDVFGKEPPGDLTLAGMEQVVATPHVGSHTIETLLRMERSCAESVIAVLSGRKTPCAVNPEVFGTGASG